MRVSVALAFTVIALPAALISGCGAGNELSGGDGRGRVLASSSSATKLDQQSRRIVETAVQQVIGDSGSTTIKTMTAAPSKAAPSDRAASDALASSGAGRTSVCGYVSYRDQSGGSAQQRYFIEIGREAGRVAALRGQVGLSPASVPRLTSCAVRPVCELILQAGNAAKLSVLVGPARYCNTATAHAITRDAKETSASAPFSANFSTRGHKGLTGTAVSQGKPLLRMWFSLSRQCGI